MGQSQSCLVGGEDAPGCSKSSLTDGIITLSNSVYSLREPATGSPEVEIVFVHGRERCDWRDAYWKAWMVGLDTDVFWPRVLLGEDLPGARILSLSYDPSTMGADTRDIHSLVEILLRGMVEHADIGQQENCPVVFVCHGLGGVVAKEIVSREPETYSDKRGYVNFLQNIGGVFFYASPHERSKLGEFASRLPCVGQVHGPLKATYKKLGSAAKMAPSSLCQKEKKKKRKLGPVNARDHFSSSWEFLVVPEMVKTTSHGCSVEANLCMYFMHGAHKPKGKDRSSYKALLELINAAIGDVQFNISVSKLWSSIVEEVKKAKINVSQCKTLVNRMDGIVNELKVQKSVLKGEGLAQVHAWFLILLTRARSLVSECGGSEWVKTALVRANNKEAFEKVHEELTKFVDKYVARFSSTSRRTINFNGATLPPRSSVLNEDAEHDVQDMLEKLNNYKRELEQGLNPKQGLNPTQPLVEDVGKIIKVVSDKSKDEEGNHGGEQGSSASYLQIPRSEIYPKRLIGTGSYGDVHEAEWLGCRVCLKDFPWSGGYGEQWLKQAMPILKLRHPNVLQLVGFSQSEVSNEKPKVLTEVMQGDIRSLIDRRLEEKNGKGPPFKWGMTLDIMMQVARGLACMHENGFMHGDRVLTTNIIIKACGDYVDARIGDFGVPLDIPVEYTHVYEPRLNDLQGALTAKWMAPEVCARTAFYSPECDIYSFGIFCYEVLTGKIPFDHLTDNIVEQFHSQILTGKLRPELPDDLDERVANMIKMCWHANPSKRPKAQAIVDTLENIPFPVNPLKFRQVSHSFPFKKLEHGSKSIL